MDCANIQRHLSEYVDGVLDAQTKDKMEKHLSSCKNCRSELEALEALVYDLGTVKPVKAPDDFLDQLHKRMDTRFDFKKVLQRLSIPFRTRIPLQLATAAAMAVLIFAIVYVPQMKRELSDTATINVHETLEEQEKDLITASKPMELKTEISTESAPQLAKSKHPDAEKQDMPADEETAVFRGPQSTMEKKGQPELKRTMRPPVPVSAAAQTAPRAIHPEKAERIELSLLLKRPDTEAKGPYAYSMETQTTPASNETRTRTLGAASPEEMDSAALKDQKTVDYMKEGGAARETIKGDRVQEEPGIWVLSPYEARRQVEALITNHKGTLFKTDYKDGTDIPISIDAEIPADQYALFYDQLKKIGTLEPSMPVVDANRIDPIRVRVRLVAIHPKGP